MDIIDINVFETTETVDINVTPNLTTININRTTNVSPVTSVNGQVGDVIIPTPDLTGYVPYSGATEDLNLGEFGLQTGNIEFDLTPTNAPTNVGSLVWNDLDGTLDLKLKGGAVTLQIGQETVARVVNKTVTLLESNYQAVRVTGAQGQRPKIDLAMANNDLNSATTLGLVTETILNNQEGFITISGQVREINTTGSLQGETWADGDLLYLSGTVAGQITNIKPVAPVHTIIIGFVEYAHAIHGKIFVKVDNGYELDELHNVSAITPNNNEALVYETSTSLWKPKEIITDAIVDGVTSVAPSQNAVFDALALKQNILTNPITGTGTLNYIPKFTAGSTLADSTIIQLANGDITINGIRAGKGNNTLSDNTIFGIDSGKVITTGAANSLFGFNAGISLAGGGGNTFIGRMAGNNNSSGSSNTFIGMNAGYGNSTFSNGVSVGHTSGYGTDCTFVGAGAGKNQSGSYNSYFGKNSGQAANANSYNSYFGNQSGENSTSTQNSFFGHGTGLSTTGANNTFLGTSAGQNNTSGNNNVYIGQQAGLYISGGSVSNALSTTSVLIGAETKTLASGDTNEIVIGYNATGLGSNSVVLGNNSIVTTALKGNVGIGLTSFTGKLAVAAGNISLNVNKDAGNYLYLGGYGSSAKISTSGTNDWILLDASYKIQSTASQISLMSSSIGFQNKLLFQDTAQGLTTDDNRTTIIYGNDYTTPLTFNGRALYTSQFVFNRKLTGAASTALLTNFLEYGVSRFAIDGIGNVGFGNSAPVASAKVQIDSTTSGFLPPRMTTAQKTAIVSPATGLIVYDTTTNKACCYNGSTWNDLF